jgi:hypothetical protein
MRRVLLAALLVLGLASAGAAPVLARGPHASARGGVNARLRGTFTMHGTITVAHDVYGERAGQRLTRAWTFYPECQRGACKRVLLKRLRSGRGVRDSLMLERQRPGVYGAKGRFWIPLKCGGHLVKHGGLVNERITVRITRAVRVDGARYATAISATYRNPSRYQYTRCPGGIGHDGARYRGTLRVQSITATAGGGYLVLSADGGVYHFGPAVSHGDEAGTLGFRERAVGLAVDRASGGYWILNSNGAVRSFAAPADGSLAGRLHGKRAVAIAASGKAGYLILTADGGVHPFGGASYHGSDRGKLAHGVRAVSIAVGAGGGYWVLSSNGAVHGFGTRPEGSLRGKLHDHRAVQIAAGPGGGYLILTRDGGVHPFGKATWRGSDAGRLPSGVGAVALAIDPKTRGYWILKSDDGIDAFHAPWEGSLT